MNKGQPNINRIFDFNLNCKLQEKDNSMQHNSPCMNQKKITLQPQHHLPYQYIIQAGFKNRKETFLIFNNEKNICQCELVINLGKNKCKNQQVCKISNTRITNLRTLWSSIESLTIFLFAIKYILQQLNQTIENVAKHSLERCPKQSEKRKKEKLLAEIQDFLVRYRNREIIDNSYPKIKYIFKKK